ncbi:MAG: NUDIX domain-containing protein [Patescibacteria group bacterium]|jgi:mutator protein MutT
MVKIALIIANKLREIWWFIARPTTQGVKAIIINNDKFLMVRLSYFPNTWTFPGGGINKNESPKEAIVRECEEETGITLNSPKLIKTFQFTHEYKKDTVYVFQARTQTDTLDPNSKEIIEAKWFNKNQLPKMGKIAQNIFKSSLL